ncbi:hypothetical protein [Streptomyces puniciscabiei]|uniref:hypothetical protein n=1 Tax=Streptomyces puniciscabiei TaxID=164348 RepID=UPI00114F33E6|nr:hypothetical protein [Streptomyces puniciscabiei]
MRRTLARPRRGPPPLGPSDRSHRADHHHLHLLLLRPHEGTCEVCLAGHLPFEAATIPFRPGGELVLYTDDTCDQFLGALRSPSGENDLALLIARVLL